MKLIARSILFSCIAFQTTLALGVEFEINKLSSNGQLTWSNTLPNASFRVEWSSSLTPQPEWNTSWSDLSDIVSAGELITVQVPMFYRVVGTSPATFNFADYLPLDPNVRGRKVFGYSEYPAYNYETITNEIVGFKTVPYQSGSVVGVYDSEGALWYNGGTYAQGLGYVEDGNLLACLSSDASLTSHVSCWEMSQIYDGMIVTLDYYVVAPDLTLLETNIGLHKHLFEVQDITVPADTYTNCIIIWFLANTGGYVAPDYHGTDIEMTLSTPSSTDTGGWRLDDFEVYAPGVGVIASGNFNEHSGYLKELKRLNTKLAP